jgi:hypothetical protein
MEDNNNNVEVPNELRERRKSMKSEIEKIAQEKQRLLEEQNKLKEFAKNNLFSEIQKEAHQREEEKSVAEDNKKIFSNEVLSKLPKKEI